LYIAINILLILAISDKLERVFLGGRCIVLWERAQMGVENLKRVEYSKHWKQSGILDEILKVVD
jgi:hypothetical protein